jgi:uncharacterized iron-regulated membrane protein
MKLVRRFLILTHRYLGIVFSALIVMWFATGITMMYVGGMPRLTPELRLERIAPVDVAKVRLTPAEAVDRAELSDPPTRATLLAVLGRPAYRFSVGRDSTTVFADTGEVADEFTVAQTRDVAARFMRVPLDKVRYVATLDDTDQWTLGMGRIFPLHKFAVDDGEGSELYVSPTTGDAVMLTTAKTRAFAWISTIPHWLYFEALREKQLVWYRIVVWTSAIATAIGVLGLILGITQYRRRRSTWAAAIPYGGWLRWHYISGVVFGVFTVTWAFSGLLSMEPFEWTNAEGVEVPRQALSGGRLELAAYPAMDASEWDQLIDGAALKEVDFVRMQGDHYYVLRRTMDDGRDLGKRERLHQPYPVNGRVDPDRLIVAASTLQPRTQPFAAESIVSRVRAAVPAAPIADYQLLTEYDSYYYSRNGQTPLPVVRIRFADPTRTWLYIDPEMNQVLASIPRLARVERWLYNGLHSLDIGYLYSRPLWDIVMLVLLVGGLASSGIGLYLGVKRVVRALIRKIPDPATVSTGDMHASAR